MFLNFLGNIFASWEANFVSATMFSEVGKQGNIGRKHNVTTTIFSSLPRTLSGFVCGLREAALQFTLLVKCLSRLQ